MTLKIAKPSASGLKIAKPSGSKLRLTSTFSYDTDAAAYITAVEAADGQALETATRYAINNFVIGCKQDGIWSAIKASCILAGARTLAGALVPLVGSAPTNIGPFVVNDYNRKLGLKGGGSTKYLDCNRNNNVDPQNSKHFSIFLSSYGGPNGGLISSSNGVGAGDSHIVLYGSTLYIRNNSSGYLQSIATGPFIGSSRSSSSGFSAIVNKQVVTTSATSNSPRNAAMLVFNNGATVNTQIAFYSIGEALDLTSLDARVTDLINAIGAAF